MNDEGQSERIEQLLGALRDDNEALRDHAIASLSQLGAEAIEPLIGLMADEDVLIREAATIAIVRMGPSAVERLIEAVAEIACRHGAEGADGGQRASLRAAQGVVVAMVVDVLSFEAAR